MVEKEEGTPKGEGVEPTNKATPTPTKVEPTQSITETKEFRKELDEAVGKGLKSVQSQLSLKQAEVEKHKALAEKYELGQKSLSTNYEILQVQLDKLAAERFSDDPDAMRTFIKDKNITERERKLAQGNVDLESERYEVKQQAWSIGMAKKSTELTKETGIDVSELEACHTEEEMEVKALRFQIAQPKGEKEPEGDTPKFASPGEGGVGVDLNKMSSTELIQRGVNNMYKK